ncbi:MAG: TatD family hydrolase [Clostridia bacterium]
MPRVTLLYDSHCHLQDPAFDGDRDELYQQAAEAGIAVIVPGYTLASSEDAVNLAHRYQGAAAAVGVHPHDAAEALSEDVRSRLLALMTDARVVGVGEIGLDYYRDLSPRQVQREAFARQLQWAKEKGLPVSVHSREAEEDTLSILKDVDHHQGVLHCFSGSDAFLGALLDFGFFISIAGPVTFKNGAALREQVKKIPSNRLLVETDAPYMAPHPHRGQKNRPLWVVYTAEMVALQKGEDPKKVFSDLLSNTKRLFRRLDIVSAGGDRAPTPEGMSW